MSDQFASIHLLNDDDKPREKLLNKGISALTNAELLAILLRTGTKQKDVLSLSYDILLSSQNKLDTLSHMSLSELVQLSGLGEAKACTILSALELGRRSLSESINTDNPITSSFDGYQILKPFLMNLDHEEFWVIYLSNANRIKAVKCISKGGITGTVADLRVIFRQALELRATGMILSHNHPSGSLRPSSADEHLTKRIVEAGKIMDVQVFDHIIVGGQKYFSFADEGLIISS